MNHQAIGGTAGRATRPKWIYSQGVYIEPKTGVEVRIFGFHNQKQEKGQHPRLADVEGRAQIEGVVASIHESYMDAHGNKVAEDAVFKICCVVIICDEPPRCREVQSKYESKHPIMETYRDRASSQVETQIHAHTNIVTRSRTFRGS